MKKKPDRAASESSAATVPIRERMLAPDIMRLFACFSVISIHFFLNSKFYDAPIEGDANMTIMLIARLFFSSCVPLFMILTGYLMYNKPLSAKHYAKGMKVVWLYLLATLAVVLYRLYSKQSLPDWKAALWGTLRFNAAPYAWYVEMYLGLYLLIPFLNILFKNIPSRRWRLALIVSCFALCSLPKLVNVNNFELEGWWLHPSSSNDYQRLIPQWWQCAYPVMYYFIGCYLREHGVKWDKWVRRLILIASVGLFTLYCLWRADGEKFPWGPWTDWESPFNIVSATMLSSLMLEKKYRHIPRIIGNVISYLSGLSLQVFLVSYIFDTEFYPKIIEKIPEIPERMWSYFWVVPAVFFSSIGVSIVIDLIYRLVMWFYRLIRDDIKRNLAKLKAKHAEESSMPEEGGTDEQDASAGGADSPPDDPERSIPENRSIPETG